MGFVGVTISLELGDVDGVASGGYEVGNGVGDAKVIVIFLWSDIWHNHTEVTSAIGHFKKSDYQCDHWA